MKVNVTPALISKVVKARNAKGMSQTALGEAIGKNRSTIATLETNKLKTIPAMDLDAMERILGVTLSDTVLPEPATLTRKPRTAKQELARAAEANALEQLVGGMTIERLAEVSGRSVNDIVAFALG